MRDDAGGFAALYGDFDEPTQDAKPLTDVEGKDWRNILVWGRATENGVHPETLALVGRARYIADNLGCRVEVLLIGKELDAATTLLKKYPVDTIYQVDAEDYLPIDASARVLEQVVKKRRPEMVLIFQSRTGDAVTAYTANRLGVGFCLGALQVDVDTMDRHARVVHESMEEEFHIVTEMLEYPQFVSVQRGLFRAPMEDPYANTQVHDLKVDVGRVSPVEVVEQGDPPEATVDAAKRVVLAGGRVASKEELQAARELAGRLDAIFAVTRSVRERGLDDGAPVVGEHDEQIHANLVVAVGLRGSLETLEGIQGNPTIAAVASSGDDPIAGRAAYLVPGGVGEALKEVMDAL